MNATFVTAELVAQRHEALIAEATRYRQTRTRTRRAERVTYTRRRNDRVGRIARQPR
jgi:hypothetical protein